jgi:hypothetical protein
MTTAIATATAPEVIRENDITATGTIAVLPPCLLWAASMAASSDTNKGVLCSIDVRRTEDGNIRITSTDGHRLFRVVIPQSEQFFIAADQVAPFRLNPKAFSKAPTKKAVTVSIEASGLAQFHDTLGRPVDAGAWQAVTEANAVGQDFPRVDQLIPADDQLTCDPGKPVAFNPRYVGDFCKVAEKLSRNCVIQFLTAKSANSPCIIRAELDGAMLLIEKDPPIVVMDYLIMPVQIRH